MRVNVCMLVVLLLLALLALPVAARPAADDQRLNILNFGAIPNDTSTFAAIQNSAALARACSMASNISWAARGGRDIHLEPRWQAMQEHSRASYDPSHPQPQSSLELLFPTLSPAQTVVIPAGMTFTIGWTLLRELTGIVISIEGELLVSANTSLWDAAPRGDFGVLQFEDCRGVTVQGKEQIKPAPGTLPPLPLSAPDVNGFGFPWWVEVIFGKFDHRPHMFYLVRCRSFMWHRMYVVDSPQYHWLTADSEDMYWKDTTIFVNTEAQRELQVRAGYAPVSLALEAERDAHLSGDLGSKFGGLPTFPLNTDGIDPSARRVLIEDFYIECFDDVVAVKPCKERGSTICKCASDMTIRHGSAKWGVGLTIGSVPPHENGNCVRNITFDDVHMLLPFKALYIKSNPGSVGTGVIDQIQYNNIVGDAPLWYTVWIGPQQQKQPANGTDTGCSFLYPLNTTCETNPRVSMSNIGMWNVSFTGGITLPGVVLCDAQTPCRNIRMEHVSVDGDWLVQKDWVCKNVQNLIQEDTFPPLNCVRALPKKNSDSREAVRVRTSPARGQTTKEERIALD